MVPVHDAVTDGQFSSMVQAAKRRDGERWKGEIATALECCDRGWMETRKPGFETKGSDPGVVFVITSPGAVVFGRERIRRM